MATKDGQKDLIQKALQHGTFQHGAHAYVALDPFLLYYLQGMLMSVWHRPSGRVDHVPLLWEQDVPVYQKHQTVFERSVRAVERRGL